jgi:hypothetical protein
MLGRLPNLLKSDYAWWRNLPGGGKLLPSSTAYRPCAQDSQQYMYAVNSDACTTVLGRYNRNQVVDLRTSVKRATCLLG